MIGRSGRRRALRRSSPGASVSVRPQVLVVTGMSGAGRSTAAKVLEDLEYTVIDNIPPQLIPQVIDHHQVIERRRRIAVVVDSRGGVSTGTIREVIDDLEQQGVQTLVLFLDAEDAAIIRRYEENRRPHPLRSGSLTDAITAERRLLAELREDADIVVDTTDLNVHQLRDRITDEFAEADTARPMRVSVTSFGYKHGIPRETDFLLDVRFLPNPHWLPELRPLSGPTPPSPSTCSATRTPWRSSPRSAACSTSSSPASRRRASRISPSASAVRAATTGRSPSAKRSGAACGLRESTPSSATGTSTGDPRAVHLRLQQRQRFGPGPDRPAGGGDRRGARVGGGARGHPVLRLPVTAIVSVADNGGSSGRLTTGLGVPPPGRHPPLSPRPHPSTVAVVRALRLPLPRP